MSPNPRPFVPGGFRVNAILHRQLNRRKWRILRRLEHQAGVERLDTSRAETIRAAMA